MTENIKDALEYAVELNNQSEKIIKDQHGNEWYDFKRNDMTQLIPQRDYPKPLELSTLGSLVEYYKNNLDGIQKKQAIIVVEDADLVTVYTQRDDREIRSKLLVVKAELPRIRFDEFMSSEKFNIMLQSQFVNRADRELLLDYISKISIENGADIEDDGASQVTVIKNGVASKTKGKAPNPVTLAPYRTFAEVEQVESEFVFRINTNAQMALFEADGGRWKLEAKNRVHKYLTEALKKFVNLTILA
ncbi:hypothetical protein [Globicatella sanguinis]|uniref:hypothetical protein n=1 Tax=Globicatella sanguinis TaxID=13076 RepID=UPI000AAB6E1B|nr:hypothetical protein [Globicatella sanguinis]